MSKVDGPAVRLVVVKGHLPAGLLEAEKMFRRLHGHRQMPHLVAALRRHAEIVTPTCDSDHDEIAA